MNPQLITTILNIVFFAILAIGFLCGLKGVKKASKSLVSFIATMIVVIFLASPVTNWVLGWQFSGKTVQMHITDFIASMFGEITNETIKQLIAGVPTMLVSIVVCIVLICVLNIIFKIITNILYRIFFGKEKKYVEEVQIINQQPQMIKKEIKPKKHRLLGGLLGLIHSFLLIVVIFMPVIGIVNIVNDIAGTNEVSAQQYVSCSTSHVLALPMAEGSAGELPLKSSKDFLKESLPAEYYEYAKALDNSIMAKIGKVGNMSEKSLNLIARCEINGQTIRIGEEIRTLVYAYDEFVEFITQACNNLGTTDINAVFNDIVEHPENYDFNKFYTICDDVFKSNIVKAYSNDLLKAVVDTIVEQGGESTPKVYLYLQTAVNNYIACGHSLKDDVNALVGAFEVSAKSGLIKACQITPFNINNVTDVLLNDETATKPENEVLSQLSAKISSSNLLQKIIIEATNYGASFVQDYMNNNITFNNGEKVAISKIDSAKNISISSKELTSLISGGVKIYRDVIDVIDFDAVGADIFTIFDYDLATMLNLLGNELDVIVNMELFKSSQLFPCICEAMSNSEYSKYLSFNEIPKGSNIKNQLENIANSINALKGSQIIALAKAMNETNADETYDQIIDELGVKDASDQTLSNRILSPIMSCSILKNTMSYCLEVAHGVIETAMKNISNDQDLTIADFNTSNIMTQDYNNQLLSMVNLLVNYAKDISIANLRGDALMDELIESNLQALGELLDAVKTSYMFQTSMHESTYNDIITALGKSELNQVLNFEVAKQSSFVWKTELTALQNTITTLNQIEVTTTSGTKGLISYLLNGGDFNDAYNALTAENVTGVKPIFEISLIKPLAITVVNAINGMVKDFVGDDLGANIVDITAEADIASQSQEITDVISAAIEIDFNETNLDNINKAKLNALLQKLEVNASHNGVFTEAYNALLLKTANMINDNIKTLVGNVAGSQIETITQATNILTQSQSIIDVLNSALDTVKSLKGASLETLDTQVLFSLINTLKDNSTTLNGVFAESYNAIMVYIINTVNDKIVEYVNNSALTSNVVTYSGTTNVTDDYNFIKEVVERASQAYKAIPTGGELADIDSTKLNNLLRALNSLGYTQPAYKALNIKLANEVITSINSITGESVALIETLIDISGQEDDIKDVVNVALNISTNLQGSSLKVSEMSEQDKADAVELLNALQTNAVKTNSVFGDAYNSLVNKIATQNGTTKELIYSNYATEGVVDWANFVNAF